MTPQTPQALTMMPKVAHRLDRLPPYGFAVIGQRIVQMMAAGQDVIRLDIGSPDMPPPPAVIAALKNSADNPNNHSYGSYRGLPAFRQAIARYYQRRFGVELHPDKEILPLIGSKEGIVNLTLAYLDRGDAAICPDINYPAYSMGALMAGADVIELRLDPERGYRPDLESIRAHPMLDRAKLLWVNYPNNPTGATLELDGYAEILEFCRDRQMMLCSDNPYAEVVFDGYQAPSALQLPDAKANTVEFMSLSKLYNMAGWRLGACVGNAEAIEALLVVKSNMDSGHFKPVYDAGVVALDETTPEWIAARNLVYQARRDKLVAACPEIGLEAVKTSASLYVWARVAAFGGDERAYTEHMLDKAAVSITPGSMFGPAGRGHVRISLGTEDARLDDALARLRGAI
jgi:LL-diaminopimelate aminotransferase